MPGMKSRELGRLDTVTPASTKKIYNYNVINSNENLTLEWKRGIIIT